MPYSWSDWLGGRVDLVLVMDPDGNTELLHPRPGPGDCPVACNACPRRIAQELSQGIKATEFRRECDGRWHRATASPASCIMHDKEVIIARMRSLDPSWDTLTKREREFISACRAYGYDSVHLILNISINTARAHRRSVCSKASLVGPACFHQFVIHNG